MINLNLFPSKRLALYLVRLFLTRSFAVLFALVLVLMTLDLLGESGKILAVPGNGDKDLWHYVILRIPLLVSRFLPFAVLLGTLIALAVACRTLLASFPNSMRCALTYSCISRGSTPRRRQARRYFR